MTATINTNFEKVGSGDTFSITGSTMLIGTVNQDTITGSMEEKAQVIVLYGENIGQVQMRSANIFPIGTTSGEIGFVFGYKSIDDYWLKVLDIAAQADRVYHVVSGSRSQIATASRTIVAGNENYVYLRDRRNAYLSPSIAALSGGWPSGKVG